MADKTIGQLPAASSITDDAKFVCEDAGVAKQVTASKLKETFGGGDEIAVAGSNTLGGVKADPVTESDTQPVRIGADNKLYTTPGGGGASSAVLYDSEQTLSNLQKARARQNIGAVSSDDVDEAISAALGDYPAALSALDAVIGGDA